MPGMHRHRVKPRRLRLLVQLAAAAVCNGYAAGFARGTIFTGRTKSFCVPVLNCYSCPGALGACPIGALQAVAGGSRHHISFYVLGTLMLFGTVLGRLICGFLCPFGLVQDLLGSIPVPKLTIPEKTDRALRFVKYAVLLGLVLLLPAVVTNEFGLGEPWFCKYLCPAGTLGGGIPLLLGNASLRKLAGGLFSWKLGVLAAVLTGSVFVRRCFCRYLCPLGAFYSLFNRFALYQMTCDADKCTGCGKCTHACPMAISPPESLCSGECIRCGQCRSVCPEHAISGGFPKGKSTFRKES